MRLFLALFLIAASAFFAAPASAQGLVVQSIAPSNVPSRTTGVAPLAASFDASATTDWQDTLSPFHFLDYSWNYGDVTAGNWTLGSGNASAPCGNGMSSTFVGGISDGGGVNPGTVLTVVANAASVGSVGLEVPLSASGITANTVVTGQTGSPSIKGQAGTYTVNGAAQFVATDTTLTDNTLCINTTSHITYYGSGTLGTCLGTSSFAAAKEGITPIQNAMKQLSALRPVNYFYRPGFGDNGAREQYGFIAEEYATVFPNLSRIDAEGHATGVDMYGLVPVLVSAVKELKTEIADLKRRVP
jgi:hypothetical protein